MHISIHMQQIHMLIEGKHETDTITFLDMFYVHWTIDNKGHVCTYIYMYIYIYMYTYIYIYQHTHHHTILDSTHTRKIMIPYLRKPAYVSWW